MNYAFFIKGKGGNLANPNEVKVRRILEEYDFLGKSIDEGFRVASLSRKGTVTISFDIAFLLSYFKGLEEEFFAIVGFKHLKGIWEDNLYPVCWYFKNRENYKDFVKRQPYYFLPSGCEILAGFEGKRLDDHEPGYATDIWRLVPVVSEYLTNLMNIIEKLTKDDGIKDRIANSKDDPTGFEEFYKKRLSEKGFKII